MVPKNSPDPTGAENPATPPGEGVLSSDLDKIPTEGQAGPLNRTYCPHLPAKDVTP